MTTSKCTKCGMFEIEQKGLDFVCRSGGGTHDNEKLDMIADVSAFHEKFGLKYDGPPRLLPDELREFRVKFLDEESREYATAVDSGRILKQVGAGPYAIAEALEEQLDALVDAVYVALGNAYMQGFPVAEAWRRVHAANMAKVRATAETASSRGGVCDVVKPPGWQAPDHSDLVADHAHRGDQ